FKRFKEENRILHEKWQHYDTQHVVFKPAQMSPEELDKGFRWAYKRTFKLNSIIKRIASSGFYMPITFVGNVAYKIYVKRLQQEKDCILYN
ncbi:MAG: radical SAM protein, partial [Candidatus Neomarinimicrobiota bacterium]